MTCPCGHYDYVDSTPNTLDDDMTYHRKHGNRILHEKLTGSPLFQGDGIDPHEPEKELLNKMRLYQHSARCPVALRSFLECNPKYWCFVPLHRDDALADNAAYHNRNSTIDSELVDRMGMTPIDSRRVDHYLQHVPKSPVAYAFSYGQVQKQRIFFENFVSSHIHQLPYHTIDLYKMAIIAVRK
ncbi:unnamed protein product [Rotaria sp. Silwood1]|nr:unnamed protein product [Rotaria sp. Silwood1]CAF1627630.1 unnamed protein product [Rotaria sp. Silwood1]